MVAQLFARVLVVCDRQGLIGRELFAIDGVKLPSNAGKAPSGSRQEFIAEAERTPNIAASACLTTRW